MEQSEINVKKGPSEVNLKVFVKKLLERKLYFLISVPVCLGLAILFVKLATPLYEVSATMLIDTYASGRKMGENQFVPGGVNLIETEKNLFNEIGILQSYNLVEKTLRELDFEVSYHVKNKLRTEEYYGYFPFEIELVDSSAQLLDVPINIEFQDNKHYRIKIEAEEFVVSNPATGTQREVSRPLELDGLYEIGKDAVHDYFHFRLVLPKYKVSLAEFEGLHLHFQIHSLEDLANGYLDKLEVEKIDIAASILTLRTKGEVVDKEVDFLNKLTEKYIQAKLNERNQIAAGKESFIQKQLAGIADSLKQAERSLEAFRRSTKAIDLSRSASNALDKLQQLESDKAQAELNIKYYKSVSDYLEDSSGIDKIIAPTVMGINDPLLNENLLELKRLNSEKNRKKFFQENTYDLKILDQQIKSTTQSLKENLRTMIESSELTLTDKNTRIGKIESTIDRLPNSEKELLKYQRRSTLYENLYNYLSQELAKAGIARAEDIPDTKVLDAPRMVGDGPVSPQKMLIYLLGMMVGLFIPVAVIVFFETFDETVGDVRQIEHVANIPVCASIGHFNVTGDNPIADARQWQVEESFRDLSASLQFLMPDTNKNIIGVTSTIPGEGKTFCSTNLSLNFAAGGKKVLIIDSDLRNPSLMSDVETIKGRGLSDYLMGKIDYVNEIIYQHEELPNLHYIPTYPVESNPHKLLTSLKLKALIMDLKDEYDYIIFDSPPVGLVSDYLLLSHYIDIHLFVVRRKYSKLNFLTDIERIQERGKLDNLYIIFNDVKDDKFKYGYNNYKYQKNNKGKKPPKKKFLTI